MLPEKYASSRYLNRYHKIPIRKQQRWAFRLCEVKEKKTGKRWERKDREQMQV